MSDGKINVDVGVLDDFRVTLLKYGESSEYYCKGLSSAVAKLGQSGGNDSVFGDIQGATNSIVSALNGIQDDLNRLASKLEARKNQILKIVEALNKIKAMR